ncbi:MAG: cytochrome c-type bioproteinis protein [Candidatus Frackibacter sp. T328-2]|nr:MAG: cytochrome c-type bioproteinis protein [Candidatus Frackibacter sp. T328-2]
MKGGNLLESIYLVAFITGLFSFLSPCIIPMLTVYFTLITGLSLDELKSNNIQSDMKRHVIINTLLFIAAFTLIFTLMGGVAGAIGNILKTKMRYFNLIGGIFVIILALRMMGLIRLSFLNKFNLRNKISIDNIPTGYKYLSTFLVGVFFAIVCSHCIGATLYSMLILTGASTTNGSLVMLFFSFGLAIPYFLVGLAFHRVVPIIERLGKHQKKLQIFMGLILIVFGVLMITNEFTILTKLLNRLIPFRLPYSM